MGKVNWIQSAIKHPGSLRKTLGVSGSKNIPKAKLNKAAHGSGVTAKRANLAKTLASFHKK